MKAVIFGAGGAGKNLTAEILSQGTYEIIAYADNDPNLQGTTLFDKPVIHPAKIAELDYDKIFIAALDTHNIKNQLINEYGIKSDSINDTLSSSVGNHKARIIALKNSASLIYEHGVSGAATELGVFQGEFAKYINEYFPDRKLYLFDTFEGFANSDVEKEKEIGTKRIFERSYDYSGTNIEIVMGKMKHPKNVIVKKGFFPETAAGLLDENFAFVSLDADLYQPMLEGLKYFYPRLSKGGFIFIHDFFTDIYTGVRKAVMEYKKENNFNITALGDDSSIVIT